ncbi:MAG: tetratricopeptide repeat protein [Gammaproteobacteria bacterium]|nr:tetratricopeptide repeat protein [Gammaproteobacteria bacterium]MBU1623768.1 tetratricopeptide repeat protein [Gammaproteobacteria bacterium]
MTNIDLPKQPEQTATDEMLQQAIVYQQAGEFQHAGERYLSILQIEPNHPQANHNMGLLAVQMQQPAASLPYFTTALDADPSCGQYWLNYIDALFQAGQLDDARQVLALAQQQGLQGDEVDALAIRLREGAQGSGHSDTVHQRTPTEQVPSQCTTESKPEKTNKASPKHSAHKGKAPSQQDINALITLFSSGRLQEATPVAQAMTERFPQHDFGWKALGAIYKQLGRASEALLPMQKAAMLAPGDVEAHYNLGVTFQELGQLNEAETSYRQAIRIAPNYAQAHSNLGVILQQHDRFEEAESCYRHALQISPGNGKTLSNLGVVLHKLGRFEEAEACFRKALKIDQGNAETYCNLGNTLKELGRPDESEASYRHALQINPDYAEAHYNIGNVLRELDRLDEAKASYQRALQITPNLANVHFNLGNAFSDTEQLSEAEASYKRAIEIDPHCAEIHFNLGNVLLRQTRLSEAEASFKQALEINPEHVKADYNLGLTYYRQGRLSEAGIYYWRALKINPEYAEVYCSLAELLHEWGRLDEAEESLQKAIKLKPDLAEAHAILGVTLTKMGRLAEAEASCQRAIDLKPHDAIAHSNLGAALFDHGHHNKAEDSYRLALKHQPLHHQTHSNLLFCMSHNAATDAKSLFDEHLRFAAQFEKPLRDDWKPHANSKHPDRTLQIGFVSGDFKNHAVSNFIEPILAHLATCPRLSLHAYASHIRDDDVSLRLRKYFAHWHPIAPSTDEELAEQIRADEIDILIDLSGHTGYNRLQTFARKPAPLQVSWMGYPGTTGLTAMDYYFADPFLLPEGMLDSQFTEKIVRLPANAPFLPFPTAPPVNNLPALKNGHITFGSFNRLSKLNRSSIALWSKLLRALPNSRMLLAGMPQDKKYDALVAWFAEEGIERHRLDLHPRSIMDTYMALHLQVDICLDTVPYNGGTTTLHALWMGVPTLTEASNSAAGRSGAAILSHAGLEKFIAYNDDEFVQQGIALAGDFAALADIRTGLRERFAQSAMGQPAVIAAGVERALRIMWQRWCTGLPPASFEVTSQEAEGLASEAKIDQSTI